MSAAETLFLADAEAVLRREAEKLGVGSALDRLLLGWLLPENHAAETKAVALSTVSDWRHARQVGSPLSYQAVGAIAITTLMDVEEVERRSAFIEGLDWALGTSTEVDGTLVGLAADPPVVLAVSSALLRTRDLRRQESMRSWVMSVLDKFGERLVLWDRAQLQVASQLLGDKRSHPSEITNACRVIRVAVAPPTEVVNSIDAVAIRAAVLEYHAQIDAVGAAFLLSSLSRAKASTVHSIRTDTMTVDDILALLRNVGRSLRDWTWEDKPRTKASEMRRWHIDHEYHVQSLLWVVLAPLFRDLESESYSMKLGFTQPRADLVIPSLKLIVEAKFARATDSLREIQRQLAQDAAMYFPKGGEYDRMIAFVWDDAARSEEHATLVQGLEKLEHVVGVVVVSRPSKMQPPAPPMTVACGDQVP